MTPVSLNPPGPNSLLQGQNQFINFSPIDQNSPTLFNIIGGHVDYTPNHDHHQDHEKLKFQQDGSSSSNNHQQLYNNSSSDPKSARDTNLSSSLEEESGHGSEKWMSPKMRLMKKMINTTATTDDDATKTSMMRSSNNTSDKVAIINTNATTNSMMNSSQRSPRSNNSGGNNIPRVCSDCNTTTTPLWRSGPMGPKSLCNACGIRQRKARRAMAEAENGLATSPKPKVHNKEKKPGVNNTTQFKKKNVSIATTPTTSAGSSSQDVKKLESYALNLSNNSDFEDAFHSDEATEAALLLMRISSGKFFNLN